MSVITHDEFKEWKHHPVTKLLFQQLNEDLKNLAEEWQSGTVLNDPITNAKWVGMSQAIREILEFKPDEVSQ
jgi:hypothetical protein